MGESESGSWSGSGRTVRESAQSRCGTEQNEAWGWVRRGCGVRRGKGTLHIHVAVGDSCGVIIGKDYSPSSQKL